MSDVAYFEEADFDQNNMLKMQDDVVCLVYANWCPPCQSFKPIFFDLSGQVKAKVAAIELDGHLPGQKELADKIHSIVKDLQGTPTVCLFRNGRVVAVYDGDRSFESLVEFCETK